MKLTNEMQRVLDIMRSAGFVCSGIYIENGCRKRDIAGATLQALARRGLATLSIHADGGLMARPK